jgi:voltage-gated potassium channel
MTRVADAGESRPSRVRPAVEWTMFALALLMVPLVIIQESSDDADFLLWTERLSALIWVAFVGEYVYLLLLADNKRQFVRGHWFDLLIIALTPPIALLPNELDALRALRAVRVVRAIAVIGRANHTLRRFLRRDSLPYVVALSVFVVVVGGLVIHALEPETAETVGDGLWWAAATLSTVGYGDIAPKTVMGRALAVVIMVVGVSTFALLTAGIASLFVRAEDGDDPGLARIHAELQEIRSQLAALGRPSDSHGNERE